MTTNEWPAKRGDAMQAGEAMDEAGVASALEAGDYAAAIAALTRRNRLAADPALERRLIDLRITGFRHATWPARDWSQDWSPRFSTSGGLPEIDARELDAGALRSGVLGSGALIVRGLMHPERAAATRDNIHRALVTRRDLSAGGVAPDNPWFCRPQGVAGGPVQFDRLGGEQYTDSGSLWAVDSPRSAFSLIDFYRQVGLHDILQQYFGEPAVLSVRKWVLRCMPPNTEGESAWHQDGRFIGEDIRTLNLWLALSDCGEGAAAPGIELVPGNRREIFPTGTHGAVFDWTVGPGLVEQLCAGREIIRPRFRPGDAVFFDHFNLHRTAFGSAQTERRYAVESWFFAASRAPAKQQPLLL